MPDCPRQLPVTGFPTLHSVNFQPYLREAGDTYNWVINADSAYRALYAGYGSNYTPPAVDFATHTLLIGKIRITTSGQSAAQQVTKTCTGRYPYSVQVTRGVGQAYMDVVYHAVVDKLPANAQPAWAPAHRAPRWCQRQLVVGRRKSRYNRLGGTTGFFLQPSEQLPPFIPVAPLS